MEGCIFNIQRFSVHDGHGIRTNVFLKGGPLRCLWCHNPEGLKKAPQIRFSPEKCIGCGDCAAVCHGTAHHFEGNMHQFVFDVCEGCMECPKMCPAEALEADGEMKSAEKIIEEVLRDRDFYEKSGGGLTLSGGEPFCQSEFAIELLRLAKENGLNTAVETCGMTSSDVIMAAAPLVDTFLFDYKATGEQRHKELTGSSNTQILNNLSLLGTLGANVILRCPMIPGLNDNDEHYRGIAETADKYDNIKEINIMPYHSMGVSKGIKVGIAPVFTAESMTYARAEEIKKEIEKYTRKEIKVI